LILCRLSVMLLLNPIPHPFESYTAALGPMGVEKGVGWGGGDFLGRGAKRGEVVID
jgi:hypothetical protein